MCTPLREAGRVNGLEARQELAGFLQILDGGLL